MFKFVYLPVVMLGVNVSLMFLVHCFPGISKRSARRMSHSQSSVNFVEVPQISRPWRNCCYYLWVQLQDFSSVLFVSPLLYCVFILLWPWKFIGLQTLFWMSGRPMSVLCLESVNNLTYKYSDIMVMFFLSSKDFFCSNTALQLINMCNKWR